MTLNRAPSPTRQRLRTRAAFGVAALALGAGLLAGCGDDGNDDASGVSESEFCALIAEFETSLDASEPTPEQWDEAQGVAGDLAGLGVPDSFPDEHRGEYDEVLDLVRSQEPAEFAATMSSWDEEKLASMEKIGDYFEETCGPLQDE